MAIVNATDKTFSSETGQGVTLVDFWAPWCGPCRQLSPVLEELEKETNVKIVKMNVDENPEIPSQLGIMGIPALVLMKNGAPVDKMVGFQNLEKLKAFVSH